MTTNDRDEQVKVDSEFARSIGFTSDKFFGWGWIKGTDYYVSFIESLYEGQGNFRAMVDALLAQGFTVKVPTPFARMRSILERLGFRETVETFHGDACDVWVKP